MANQEKFKAAVEANNRLNQEAAKLWNELQPVIRQWVGKKILKASNRGWRGSAASQLMERFKNQLPALSNQQDVSIWWESNSYSLRYGLRICVPVDGSQSVEYHWTSVYFGDIQDGVLVSVYDDFRGDAKQYAWDALWNDLGEVLELRKDYEKARDRLPHFVRDFE